MENKTRLTYNEKMLEKLTRIRRLAEERVAQWPDLAVNAQANLIVMIHELKIHLAELEIQNEELKLAIRQLVSQQENDDKIYDFGPLKEKTGKLNRDYQRVNVHRVVAFKRVQEEEKW